MGKKSRGEREGGPGSLEPVVLGAYGVLRVRKVRRGRVGEGVKRRQSG